MSRNKKTSESLFQFMNLLIALLQKNGQYRTSLHYRATLNSFKRYRDNKDIALSEIDAEVMHSYEAYLHHTAKVCRNTSSFYLRILRATYNKAVAKGLTPQQHPFSDVYTGIAPTRKRAIPTEDVSQIKSLQSVKDLTPKEEMARDTFLMSFYLRGISFIDLAHLRKSYPLCRPPFLGNDGKRQRYLYLRHQRGIGTSFRNHHANLSQFHQKL